MNETQQISAVSPIAPGRIQINPGISAQDRDEIMTNLNKQFDAEDDQITNININDSGTYFMPQHIHPDSLNFVDTLNSNNNVQERTNKVRSSVETR